MFIICKIIVESKDSVNNLKKFLSGYPVEITDDFSKVENSDVPTMIVGWSFMKKHYPNQKIDNFVISEKINWTYNEEECNEIKSDETFYKKIELFVSDNMKKWLPSNFELYDPIFCGDFFEFINNNINKDIITYIHFNNGAIYLRNGDKNIIINSKSMWLIELDYRSVLTKFFNDINCLIYSYKKIEEYVYIDKLNNIKSLDIIRWVKFGVDTPKNYFQIIPKIDINKYIPFLMSKIPLETLYLDEKESIFLDRMCYKDKIERWASNRYIPFSYNFNKNLNFIYRENAKLANLNYSTKKTLTGRLVCDDVYNVQNLKKDGNDRLDIISKYKNGKIYQFDYTSFEARIALYLTEDDYFIQEFYDKDLHSEVALIMFETLDFTKEQREIAKLANMAIMYGASESTILEKLSVLDNPKEKFLKIKSFLAPIFKKSKEIIERSKKDGYIINKWGSIIKPEKDFAAFNNYLQSTAAEITIDKLYEIKDLLIGYKSSFLFQVFDSFVFDIHPDEEFDLIPKITKLLSYNKGMLFSVNYKSGFNYKELSNEVICF